MAKKERKNTKKQKIIILVMALLAIGYTGSSWLIGYSLESGSNLMPAVIAQKIEHNYKGYTLAINYNDYQRGVFTSSFHLTISTTTKKNKNIIIFNDKITLHHGPLPVAALVKGEFTPRFVGVDKKTILKRFLMQPLQRFKES